MSSQFKNLTQNTPSPKRKRDDNAPALHLDISSSSDIRGPDSPRSKVAERLQALQLHTEEQYEKPKTKKKKVKKRDDSKDSQRDQDMLDRAALCWQEDEITGHDIDTLSGDDGLGINGVGFKPTPAIAQERLARRRRQIFEWKAREAREARQKRIDRRCGRGGEKSHEGPPKRTVRFAA